MGLYMNESMDSDYLSAAPSEAQVYAAPLDDDMVAAARAVPGVDAVAGFSSLDARIVRPDGSLVDVQFTAIEDPNTLTVNILKPLQGETTLPKYGDEETIFDNAGASLGYKPGDMILLELENGKRRKIRFTGFMHDVTGFPYNLTQRVSAYVTPETLEWLGGSPTYNVLAVSVAENPTDREHVTEVAQAVADRMQRAGAIVNFVSVYQPGHHAGHLFCIGRAWLPDRSLKRLPNHQYGHRTDDSADAPGGDHESNWRQDITDFRYVPGTDPGLRYWRLSNRYSAWELCGKDNWWWDGNMAEFLPKSVPRLYCDARPADIRCGGSSFTRIDPADL
jgi:hypothetical protein